MEHSWSIETVACRILGVTTPSLKLSADASENWSSRMLAAITGSSGGDKTLCWSHGLASSVVCRLAICSGSSLGVGRDGGLVWCSCRCDCSLTEPCCPILGVLSLAALMLPTLLKQFLLLLSLLTDLLMSFKLFLLLRFLSLSSPPALPPAPLPPWPPLPLPLPDDVFPLPWEDEKLFSYKQMICGDILKAPFTALFNLFDYPVMENRYMLSGTHEYPGKRNKKTPLLHTELGKLIIKTKTNSSSKGHLSLFWRHCHNHCIYSSSPLYLPSVAFFKVWYSP